MARQQGFVVIGKVESDGFYMNNQNKGAGKGPETRKGANFKKYWDNYDSIFSKSPSVGESETRSLKKAKKTSNE